MLTEIYGISLLPKLGSRFKPDGWKLGTRLEKGDDFSEYRCPTNSLGPVTSLAVKVEPTGRTLQRFQGERAVRCKITFPGDCEPDQVTSGWLWV